LSGGGSETQFTVDLPAQAACSGDTATDGYHVFSYLLPKGTSVQSITFSSSGPSAGLGFADGSGYYGSANTAPTTGQNGPICSASVQPRPAWTAPVYGKRE
jgi:hypothetical protein